jgi:hypothetical protein
MDYDKKYLKYKTKYFKLVEELEGGGKSQNEIKKEWSWGNKKANEYENACNNDKTTCLENYNFHKKSSCVPIKDGYKKGYGGSCEKKLIHIPLKNPFTSKQKGGTQEKYLKYKTKYYELKEMIGGRHRLFGPPMFGAPMIGPPLYGPIMPLPLYSNLVVPFVPRPYVKRYIINNFTNKALLFTNNRQNVINTCVGAGLCLVNVNNNSPKKFYIYEENSDNIYSNDKTMSIQLTENEKINWNLINNQIKLQYLQNKINNIITDNGDKITTISLYLYKNV